MNRINPTDAPDEPVNRIAQFLEKMEQDYLAKRNSPEWHKELKLRATEELQQMMIGIWSELLQQNQESPASLKDMALRAYAADNLLVFILLAKAVQALLPAPDTEIECMLAEALLRQAIQDQESA